MSLASGVTALAQRIATEFNTVRTQLAGKEASLPALGGATTFLRGDRSWAALFSATAPAAVTQTGVVGAATTMARSDHSHGLNTVAKLATALPSAYPAGVSVMSVSTDNTWPDASGFGTVVTWRWAASRTAQVYYPKTGGSYTRTESGTDAWSAWEGTAADADVAAIKANLTLSVDQFTNATLPNSYPAGPSVMSVGISGGWPISPGVVVTNWASSTRAQQTLYDQGGGVSTRYSTTTNGWGAWTQTDSGWTNFAPVAGGTGWTAAALVARYRIINGALVHLQFQRNTNASNATSYAGVDYGNQTVAGTASVPAAATPTSQIMGSARFNDSPASVVLQTSGAIVMTGGVFTGTAASGSPLQADFIYML